MQKISMILTLVAVLFSGCSYVSPQPTVKMQFVFASTEQGKRILMTRDDFIERLSPFDRSARMKTAKHVSENEFLTFIGNNVLTWRKPEIQKLNDIVRRVQSRLEAMAVAGPEKIYLVKTSGNEEGGAPYTRGKAIIIPKRWLAMDSKTIEKLIYHELFHILTRSNPDLREALYAVIGFRKARLTLPSTLKSRRITNPDAPLDDHYVRLKVDGRIANVVPILLAADTYDIRRSSEFFSSIQAKFLLVRRAGGSHTVMPIYEGTRPKVVDVQQAAGFREQVGRNTGKTIQPEEILAEDFAALASAEENIPPPGVIRKIKAILTKKAIAKQGVVP